MMRRICLIAICLTPIALYYSTAAPAPAKGSGHLAIVPAQCPIVVQLHGIDRVRDRIKASLSAANPAWGEFAVKKFDSILENIPQGRKLQGLSPNGPHYLAFLEMPDGNSALPAMAFIARVNNYKTFRDGVLTDEERKKLTSDPAGFQMVEISDQPVYFLEKPDFAIVTPSKEVAEKMAKSYDGLDGKMPTSMAENFTARDVTAYVNMAEVNKVHGDTIRQFRDTMLMLLKAGAGGMDESAAEMNQKFYGGMFQLLLDSEALVVTADFRPEGLAFQTQMRVGTETITNGVLKTQKAGAMEPLAKLPSGQTMYFGASGLSPETMKAFVSMNSGMTKAAEGTSKALDELTEAKNRATFGSVSYPLSGVSVQEYEDAPRAMKATVAVLESVGEGGGYAGGFAKSKPTVKAKAENYRDTAWTSYHIVWDFDKAAEMVPAMSDEMKAFMKSLLGDELHGWIGVSGNRLIQVQAKDWSAAKLIIDSVLTSQNSVGDMVAFKGTRKELPQTASLAYYLDAGPTGFMIAELMLPMFRNAGMQIPMPEKLTPVKFVPAFVGMAITMQPEQCGLDVYVPVTAVAEVSKLVNQFLMGAN